VISGIRPEIPPASRVFSDSFTTNGNESAAIERRMEFFLAFHGIACVAIFDLHIVFGISRMRRILLERSFFRGAPGAIWAASSPMLGIFDLITMKFHVMPCPR
jgi:hypothetical protein